MGGGALKETPLLLSPGEEACVQMGSGTVGPQVGLGWERGLEQLCLFSLDPESSAQVGGCPLETGGAGRIGHKAEK